ncbi:MAG: hypothetical protein NW217_14710 [Hyphomicrobiaceae bacterium]|nr:hypothetical protein [Hyphomicrobiaceae bacterium]
MAGRLTPLLALVGLACVLLATQIPFAQAAPGDRWVRIAVKPLDLTRKEELFDIASAPGSYRAIRLQTRRAVLSLSRVVVNYADGTSELATGPILLRRGGRSQPIGTGQDHFLDTLSLVYSSERPRGTAEIEIWGLQSGEGRAAKRPETVSRLAGDAPPLPPRLGQPQEIVAGSGVLIGTRSVGFSIDRDDIVIAEGIGKFARIKLRVRENDILLHSVTVAYTEGPDTVLDQPQRLDRDSESRWLDIDGSRFPKLVRLVYASKPGAQGRARVEIVGEHAPDWLAADGEGQRHNDGWLLIGAQSAGFIGFDDDAIPVGPHRQGFKEIRVAVRDAAITLNQMSVVYDNGERHIIPVGARIGAGSTYGPVALSDSSRPLREIRVRYRSRFIDKAVLATSAAVVEVWGKR